VKRFSTPLLLALLVSCAPAGDGDISVQEANAIADNVIATFATRDPERLAAHYTSDRLMLDNAQNRPYAGTPQFMAFARRLMAANPTQHVRHRTITVLNADIFVNTTIGSVSVDTPQGRGAFLIRYTQIFQRQADGSWKIAVEHLSDAPQAEEL
jgi:uncharacterized protein (TIGR02246 family)